MDEKFHEKVAPKCSGAGIALLSVRDFSITGRHDGLMSTLRTNLGGTLSLPDQAQMGFTARHRER